MVVLSCASAWPEAMAREKLRVTPMSSVIWLVVALLFTATVAVGPMEKSTITEPWRTSAILILEMSIISRVARLAMKVGPKNWVMVISILMVTATTGMTRKR